PSDVSVESLVPGELRGNASDPEAFLERLADHDHLMEGRRAEAEARGGVLRYMAVVEAAGAALQLRHVPAGHPFASVGGADAVVAFTTERYDPRPLVIQGPGAGPGVTAGGVFADLLRLAGLLGGAGGGV
ncbi:MAG TPA: hypothetical protein VE173_14470, partial [Longimicrobiales bacterium]|nr:hypothetical protein [Longimicrobiales bacterium]